MTNPTQHTPEPWYLTERNDLPEPHCTAVKCSVYSGGEAVAKCGVFEYVGKSASECQANARRIVACVNACAGMTNEQLENSKFITFSPSRLQSRKHKTLSPLIDELDRFAESVSMNAVEQQRDQFESERNKAQEMYAELEKQRDQLLAALEKYEEAHSDLFTQCCSNPVTNAWGQEVNMSKLNDAHMTAGTAIAAVKGGV